MLNPCARRAHQRGGDPDGVHRFGDVVRPDDRRAAGHGQRRERHAARQPPGRPATRDDTDERLARHADEHRDAGGRQSAQVREQREIVGGSLAESDARVDADPLRRDAGRKACGPTAHEVVTNLDGGIRIHGIRLHRRGRALHVHQAHAGAGLRDDLNRTGRLERAHVVDEGRPRGDRCPHHLGLRSVDRHRHAGAGREALDHRQHAAEFLLDGDWLRARPGRLAANVEDRGTLPGQPQPMLDRCAGALEPPAVRERIRRHVQHPHHDRLAEVEERVAQAQVHRVSRSEAPGRGRALAISAAGQVGPSGPRLRAARGAGCPRRAARLARPSRRADAAHARP